MEGSARRTKEGPGDQVFSINSRGWLGACRGIGLGSALSLPGGWTERPSCRQGEVNIAQGSSGD